MGTKELVDIWNKAIWGAMYSTLIKAAKQLENQQYGELERYYEEE